MFSNQWFDSIVYDKGIIVVGSDNNIYRSLQKNTNKDPIENSSFWLLESSIDSPEPSGTSGQGTPVVRAFPFAYNSPGISTPVGGIIPGFVVYTPTVGDILLDAWVQIDTAWDGTTPLGDIGTYVGSNNQGFFGNPASPINMSVPDHLNAVDGSFVSQGQAASSNLNDVTVQAINMFVVAGVARYYRGVPALCSIANPLKIVVSQSGTNNSSNPGSTQGTAILYLVTATPI